MTEPRLLTSDQVDPDDLHRFLERFFGPVKAAFLRDHGAWWHRGGGNRVVLTVGDEIAGYCAVIPTRCQMADRHLDAVWWIDLIIDPKFRGLRLQSLLDVEVRKRSKLLLGFPNGPFSAIQRHHGWGVQEDLSSLVAPLKPLQLNGVRRARGLRGVLLRGSAALAALPFSLRRRVLAQGCRDGAQVRLEESPRASDLARIAALQAHYITTLRDEDFLRWRYLESPFRSQLRFFTAGPREAPRVAAILRILPPELGGAARLLDVFGDLAQDRLLLLLLRQVVSYGAKIGTHQITALAARPALVSQLRRAGFWLKGPGRFCWWCEDPEIMEEFSRGDLHWTVGDSDNDDQR